MNYHVNIAGEYFEMKYPGFHQLGAAEQKDRMHEELESIQRFCEKRDGTNLLYSGTYRKELLGEQHSYITISPLVSTEGIALIQRERLDQLNKHGFTEAHDDALDGGELEAAAMSILSEDRQLWPSKLNEGLFMRATEKNTVGRLTVAAALIAAEVDRILRAQANAVPVQGGPSLPPSGTVVEVLGHLHERLLRLGVDNSTAEQLSTTAGQRYTILGSYTDGTGMVWVRLLDGVDVPLACCAIKHDIQTP
jgi:hypothetical protein